MADNRAVKGDYIGFTFGDVHSSELGLVRVSNGSRYETDLLPPLQDKTVQVAGRDGAVYFNSQYNTKPIKVPIAFDNLNEEGFNRLKRLLADKKPKYLWFDETPYKQWLVKSANAQNLKWVCFDETHNGKEKRVYKGEGTLEFSCFSPYAESRVLFSNDAVDPIIYKKDRRLIFDNKGVKISHDIKELLISAEGYTNKSLICQDVLQDIYVYDSTENPLIIDFNDEDMDEKYTNYYGKEKKEIVAIQKRERDGSFIDSYRLFISKEVGFYSKDTVLDNALLRKISSSFNEKDVEYYYYPTILYIQEKGEEKEIPIYTTNTAYKTLAKDLQGKEEQIPIIKIGIHDFPHMNQFEVPIYTEEDIYYYQLVEDSDLILIILSKEEYEENLKNPSNEKELWRYKHIPNAKILKGIRTIGLINENNNKYLIPLLKTDTDSDNGVHQVINIVELSNPAFRILYNSGEEQEYEYKISDSYNFSEWISSSGLQKNNEDFNKYNNKKMKIYNAGDQPSNLQIIFEVDKNGDGKRVVDDFIISLNTQNNEQISYMKIKSFTLFSDDEGFIIDSKIKMIKGVRKNGNGDWEVTGHQYNKYHREGDYLKMPVMEEDNDYFELTVNKEMPFTVKYKHYYI